MPAGEVAVANRISNTVTVLFRGVLGYALGARIATSCICGMSWLSPYTSRDAREGITTTSTPPELARPWAAIPGQLRARGLRWTPQRRILVEVLSEVDGHVTGAELVERCRMRDPDTIPSTVYRTLDVLEELGVIRHSHGADGREEFHVLPAAEHAHLYCRVRRVVGTVERRPHGRDGGRCRPDRSRLPGRRAAPDAHRRRSVCQAAAAPDA